MSVEGALFSTPRHRIEAHSESIVSYASYASSVFSLAFRQSVSPLKVALTEGSRERRVLRIALFPVK